MGTHWSEVFDGSVIENWAFFQWLLKRLKLLDPFQKLRFLKESKTLIGPSKVICQIGRSKDGERGWVGGGGGASHQGDRHTRLQLLHQGYPTLGKYSKIRPHKFCGYRHEGGEVRPGEKKTQRVFKKVLFFFKNHIKSFQDPQNMFYTQSGVFCAYLQLLKQL